MVIGTPRQLYLRERDPVPILQEAWWVPGPVRTGAENFAPIGIRSPDRPARSSVAIPTALSQPTLFLYKKYYYHYYSCTILLRGVWIAQVTGSMNQESWFVARRETHIFLFRSVQTNSRAQPGFLFNGLRKLYRRLYSGHSTKLNSRSPSSAGVNNA